MKEEERKELAKEEEAKLQEEVDRIANLKYDFEEQDGEEEEGYKEYQSKVNNNMRFLDEWKQRKECNSKDILNQQLQQ